MYVYIYIYIYAYMYIYIGYIYIYICKEIPGVSLPVTLVFDYPSIGAMTAPRINI